MRHAIAITPLNESDAAAAYGFSPAVQVGNVLYTSGLIGLQDDGTIIAGLEAQVEHIFAQAQKIIETAGGTLADIVSIDSYHAPGIPLPEQMGVFMAIRDKHLPKGTRPIWMALGIHSLAFPDAFVEIRFTAVLGS